MDEKNKLWSWGRAEHGVQGNGSSSYVINPIINEYFKKREVEQYVVGTNHNLVFTKDKRF